MEEKINLSLFECFLNHHHQLIMQKILPMLKNLDGNKEVVAEIKDRMSDLKGRIKKKAKEKKIKVWMRH